MTKLGRLVNDGKIGSLEAGGEPRENLTFDAQTIPFLDLGQAFATYLFVMQILGLSGRSGSAALNCIHLGCF